MSLTMQELIKKQHQKIADKRAGSIDTVKPQPGKSAYRILPGWNPNNRGQTWQNYGLHWIKTVPGGKPVSVHLCEDKTHDKECDVCQAIGQAIGHSNNDEQIAILKECNASQRFLLNALHINGEDPKKVIVLEIGITAFEALCDVVAEYGDITALDETGTNIIINRAGAGREGTSYTVTPSAKKTKVDKKVMDELVDLEALVNGKRDANKHNIALTTIASIAGLELAGGKGLPSDNAKRLSAAKDLDSDDLFQEDDVPFNKGDSSKEEEEVTSKKATNDDDDIDDDMLDELMAS